MPTTDIARINRWVDRENAPIPPPRNEVRIEADFDDRSVTILECRPPWDPDRMGPEWTRMQVARLRYWSDRNSKFHRYDLAPPTTDVVALLDEIDRDPT